MKEKVSIIVAIYEVEKYLEKCVQSVIAQTYKNLEIILVDDGSPDNAPVICDAFAEFDKRVKVIHKKNEGSVFARRDGLNMASGKYVLMVDGDDWMDEGFVEKLVIAAEQNNSDVVVDSFVKSYESEEVKNKGSVFLGTYTGKNLELMKEQLIYSGDYFNFGINPALWNKLFETEKLRTYYKDIPQLITLGDDFAVAMPYLASAECITVIDSDSFYHYRQREDSMVNAYNPKLVANVRNLFCYLQRLNWGEKYKNQLNYYYSWIIASLIKNQIHSDGTWSDKRQKIKEIYKLPHIHNILCEVKVSSLKYKLLFTCVKNGWLNLILLLYMGR